MGLKKAVIIAGGRATRMGKITSFQPKSLLPIAGIPLLNYQLILLESIGCDDIIILAGHQAVKLQHYIVKREERKKSSCRIQIISETELTGTGGCLRLLPETNCGLLVLLGDLAVNMNLLNFIRFHECNQKIASIVVQKNDHAEESDLIKLDKNGNCIAAYPKPHHFKQRGNNIFMVAGIFILESELISSIPKTGSMDLVQDLLMPRINEGVGIAGYFTEEYIDDIGTPERYKRINLQWKTKQAALFRKNIRIMEEKYANIN